MPARERYDAPALATQLQISWANEHAQPFVWTKSKVHQRRVKGRRLGDL